MKSYLTKQTLLASLALLSLLSVRAQQQEWQKIAPVREAFTVMMPTQAAVVSRMIPLNEKDSVPERVYYSLFGGRRYVIISFARTTTGRTPSLSSVPDFIRAMEWSFNNEGHDRSLTFDTDLSDESGVVKQYRIRLGEYKGVARFMANDKSFYVQMVIGADENDSDVQRFLKSFVVSPINRNLESTNVVAISEGGATNPDFPPEPWPRRTAAISGGVLNGKALSLAKPGYPKAARKNHDEGMVKVRIVIDEVGNVISAEAIEGPESLRQAAIDAAYKSRFTPTRLMGQPVKVSGVIIYNFVAQ